MKNADHRDGLTIAQLDAERVARDQERSDPDEDGREDREHAQHGGAAGSFAAEGCALCPEDVAPMTEGDYAWLASAGVDPDRMRATARAVSLPADPLHSLIAAAQTVRDTVPASLRAWRNGGAGAPLGHDAERALGALRAALEPYAGVVDSDR